MFGDTVTGIQGIRVPLRAIRYHPPRPVHRLDRRPLPWLWIWAAIDVVVLLILTARVW